MLYNLVVTLIVVVRNTILYNFIKVQAFKELSSQEISLHCTLFPPLMNLAIGWHFTIL